MKKRVKSLSEVAEEDRDRYTKDGDWFVLDAGEEGDEDEVDPKTGDKKADDKKAGGKKDVDEYRRNNIKLMKQVAELQEKLGSIDMDAYTAGQEALNRLADAEERELMSKGKLNDVLDRRVRTMKEAHDKELTKLKAEIAKEREGRAKTSTELRETKVAMYLADTEAAMKVRVKPSARRDVKSRAYELFSLDENNNVVAMRDGEMLLNSEGKPYGPKDFFMEAFEEAPHLFEDGTGTGGNGNPKKGTGGGNGTLELDGSDQRAMGQNIEKIARGKINVRVKL